MSKPESDKSPWSERRMVRGRWRDPDAETGPPARVDKTVSVKMTEAELAEFDAQIATLGLKRNRALRIAARRIAGFVEVEAARRDPLKEIARQISGIAVNINQIARSANRTHDPDYRAFMREREALGRELTRLRADMQEILDLSARREDGLRRLEDASA